MASGTGGRGPYLFDCIVDAEPALISTCLLGIPCRWHGRRATKRVGLLERLRNYLKSRF